MYCLVAEINGNLRPLANCLRKYDAVEYGLKCMANLATNQEYNGIRRFEIWTDEIQTIDFDTAKTYYLMGYDDNQSQNPRKKAKELNLSARSLEYEVYCRGSQDSKYLKYGRVKKF